MRSEERDSGRREKVEDKEESARERERERSSSISIYIYFSKYS